MAEHRIAATVVVKDEASKQLAAIDKELQALTKRKAEIEVDADTDDAEKQLDEIDKQIKDLSKRKAELTVEANVDRALSALDEVAAEAKKAEAAAEALGKAIGPELAAGADIDRIVADFERMGLSLDDITANADQLGAKLREVGQTTTGGIEGAFSRARQGSEELGKSADSSKSALANMVGNSAQDIGDIGGAAGTAGVLIGQMAEYMADASFSGEKFGSVIKNFAAVAGPAAALGLVIATVSGFMSGQAEAAEAAAQRTEDLGDAMAGAANDTVGLADALKGNLDPLRDINAGAEILGSSFAKTVNDLGRSIPLIGRMFQDTRVDAVDALDATGKSIYDFSKAISGTEQDRAKFVEDMEAFRDAGFITSTQYDALVVATDDYAKSVDKARRAQHLMNVNQEEATGLLGELLDQRDPMRRFTAQWNTLMEDLADGTVNSKAAAAAVNELATQLGIDPSEVISLALDKIDEKNKAFRDGLLDNIDAIKQWRDDTIKAQQEVSDSLDNVTADWKAMSDAVAEESFANALDQFDALSELDLAQMRQDTVKSFDDVKGAIKEAAKEVKGWGKMDLTPDSFDELRGMPDAFAKITDAVSGMRGSIQTELKAAFDTGGVAEFSQKFDFFAGQVREQFTDLFRGMGLPETQVQKQVQAILDDLGLLPKQKEIIIKLTRDQEAKNALDLFMSDIAKIEEAEPSVDIRAKLAAGDIDGAIDELNALRILQGQDPIVLPTEVDTVGAAQATANARARAQTYLTNNPTLMTSQMTNPTGVGKVLRDTQTVLNQHPLQVGIVATINEIAGRLFHKDAGTPSMPRPGGIVGERRPEIVNGRWLVTQPTVVPPGTRVTSGARTARILRTRGTQGLRRYDAGGTVVAGPSTVNFNFNGVGAIGNRYDVMRVVKQATRDQQRLLGTRQ